MKIYKVPCWLRNEDVFETFSLGESSKLPSEFKNFKETSEINSIEDFEKVYKEFT